MLQVGGVHFFAHICAVLDGPIPAPTIGFRRLEIRECEAHSIDSERVDGGGVRVITDGDRASP